MNLHKVPNIGTVQYEFYDSHPEYLLNFICKPKTTIFIGLVSDCDFYPEKIKILAKGRLYVKIWK